MPSSSPIQPNQPTPLVAPVAASRSAGALDLAVIILNYNTRDLLADCLRSVMKQQSGLQIGVCVVDNASSDGSVEMVRRDFPGVQVIANQVNLGYSAGNNRGLRWFGFGDNNRSTQSLPRFALLLNPDTLVPPATFAQMVDFMQGKPGAGVAGPRVRRPDGSLDRACRRSFPTPQVSFYRMIGLSRLFPKSERFNAYNLEYLPEDAVHQVDSVVGAYMQVRAEAIVACGLLDESFFMYGEDLDWAKRIKDAGWEVWYNGQTQITHVKEAASSQSAKSRIDFYEAMWIFYRKHYRASTARWLDVAITAGIVAKGGLDVARHLWRFCRGATRTPPVKVEHGAVSDAAPNGQMQR